MRNPVATYAYSKVLGHLPLSTVAMHTVSKCAKLTNSSLLSNLPLIQALVQANIEAMGLVEVGFLVLPKCLITVHGSFSLHGIAIRVINDDIKTVSQNPAQLYHFAHHHHSFCRPIQNCHSISTHLQPYRLSAGVRI